MRQLYDPRYKVVKSSNQLGQMDQMVIEETETDAAAERPLRISGSSETPPAMLCLSMICFNWWQSENKSTIFRSIAVKTSPRTQRVFFDTRF